MDQLRYYNDKIHRTGLVNKLGVNYDSLLDNKPIPDDYDGWFPFSRMFSFSIGDWAIISGLFQLLHQKYPKMKLAIPSKEWLKSTYPKSELNKWSHSTLDPTDYLDLIFKNNPYIDLRFNVNEFPLIFSDHDRAYTNKVRPLVEQIMLMFGFSLDDVDTLDSRPKLYFSDEELDSCYNTIETTIGGKRRYGCLLFGTRIDNLKGRWDDKHLLKRVEGYKNIPIFYYSEFPLENTEWEDLFPERYNLQELGLSLRQQLVLKAHADVNISYQSGFNDAVCGTNSKQIVLNPYNKFKETHIRGVEYVFLNGEIKTF